MEFITENAALVLLMAAVIIGSLQIIVMLLVLVGLRANSKDRYKHSKELFGLTRRIEGLTAERRQQILSHYDSLLEKLSNKLPILVAAQAGERIFDTESKILTRLADIEPLVKDNPTADKKMNELISSMESLEETIINITSEAVRDVMSEGRRSLFDSEKQFGNGAN